MIRSVQPRHRARGARAVAASLAILACACALVTASAAEGPASAEPYRLFASDGRGAQLIRFARRAYLEAEGRGELYPPGPSDPSGRPAGPRDEPAPPSWPDRAAGIVLCLRTGEKIRACEGEVLPASRSLGEVVADLAERLVKSRSRGRLRPMSEPERRRARIEGTFVLDAARLAEADRDRRDLPPEWDPARTGFRIEGSGRAVFIVPGEARSPRKAAAIARKAGVIRRGEEPAWFDRLTVVPTGEAPLVSP